MLSEEGIGSSQQAQPAVVFEGEGEAVNILGDTYFIKVGGDRTAGLTTTVEAIIEPGSGPPPHIHHREDETFYVIEGEFEFLIEDRLLRVGAGAVVFAPRDQPHTFKNVSTAKSRFLVISNPAGIEDFYRRLNEMPAGPPDIPTVIAIAEAHGISILPPA